MGYTITKFDAKYKKLSIETRDKEPEVFVLALMVAYAKELEKGFGITKQYPTTKKGTRFIYEPIDTRDKINRYRKITSALNCLLRDIENNIELLYDFTRTGDVDILLNKFNTNEEVHNG